MMPYRSARLLAFVRSLPCSIRGCRRTSEAAHIGPHGMGQKAPDTCAAPLCDRHHQELVNIGRRRFEAKYDISLLEIADKIALRPFIHVEEGSYVGRIEGEEYVLGRVRMIDVKTAVRRMVNLRKERLQEMAS